MPIPCRLSRKKHYLQVALNSTMADAKAIISQLPKSDRILIEAGTPLIKRYGIECVAEIKKSYLGMNHPQLNPNSFLFKKISKFIPPEQLENLMKNQVIPLSESESLTPYIVADLKTMDRGATEVELAAQAGASAVVALGSAPIETLNAFIAACEEKGLDAMVDMMNVEYPLAVLNALKKKPPVVILHRGVDEEHDNKEKMLPLYEIRRIKGAYDVLISVAGGDTLREVQSSFFNDADIAVIWKSVFQSANNTMEIVQGFLDEVR